jgi:hypothetical protein
MNRVGSITIALTGWIVISVSFVLLVSAAQAACSLDLSDWTALQENHFRVHFSLRVIGNSIFGTAGTQQGDNGTVSGFYNGGETVHFRVHWRNGSIGNYSGTLRDARLSGSTWDSAHPKNRSVGWRSTSKIRCS